ncbi:MAG: dihydrolipoyl dehydrogenase [Nitrospinota bacterium]
MADFDVAVLGGGPAGYVAGIRGAQLGGRVCVIEREKAGGTCLNWGCIPTKSLIASADVLRLTKRAAEYGVIIDGEVRADFAAMMARKDKIVSGMVRGIEGLFKSHGVTHVKGRGVLDSDGRIQVKEGERKPSELAADKILLATGSRPAQFPAFPTDGVDILTSDDAVTLKEVPESLLIVGAGIIGCEFAFLFQALGCEVTVLEMLPRAVATEDEDISKTLERELKKEKIRLVVNQKIERVEKKRGYVEARLAGGETVKARKALVSIGRAPNAEDIGLETVGVALAEQGHIRVNERMQANVPGIYAAGDVAGGKLLAHKASAEGIVAMTNALGGDKTMRYEAVPAGIFTHPEIGSIGLTEAQARQAGRSVKAGRFPYRALGRSQVAGEIAGEVKVVADEATGEILGVHIIGANAAELIHEAAVAMRWELTVDELAETVHAHPTLSECVMEAAHAVRGMSAHQPKV